MSPVLSSAREVEDRQPLGEAVRIVVEQADLKGTTLTIVTRSIKQSNL